MMDANWPADHLRQLLISQQEEYHQRGLEHELYVETDETFYSKLLYHRLIVLSLIPEECRRPRTKVVDVGGGKGRISTMLSDLGLECVNMDCIYLETDTLNTEGEPLVPLLESFLEEKGVRVLARDAYEDGIPFPDDTFDLAIFSEVIEHLPNSPKPLLAEIHRTLRKEGWLILTTPNLASYQHRKGALLGRSTRPGIVFFYNMEGYPIGSVYRGHNREYTLQEVEYMLGQENFVIVRAQTCDYSARQSVGNLARKVSGNLIRDWRAGHLGVKGALLTVAEFVIKKIFPSTRDFIVILARK